MSLVPSSGNNTQSGLLAMPYDIRHAIYSQVLPTKFSFHLFSNQDRVRFSLCIKDGPENYTGLDRRDSNILDEEKWARRLQSSWGPHWKCHESVSADDFKIALVCKTVYAHILEFLGNHSMDFNVMDLDTLSYFLRYKARYDGSQQQLFSLCFLTPLLLHTKHLDLTLRFPLALCKAMDDSVGEPEINAAWASQLSIWRKLPQFILQFKNLQQLSIWIDHDDKSSWSIVNERALLSPALPLTHSDDMSITIQLPKSDPRYETLSRHYPPDSPTPNFKLSRRIRQTYHAVVAEGCLRVIWVEGFPRFQNTPGFQGRSLADLERIERHMWATGNGAHVLHFAERGFESL